MKDGLLVVIASNVVGDGEPDLGEKLMGAFLAQLLETGSVPEKMIFMGAGVFLTTSDDTGLNALLKRFEEDGTVIRSCGTCLEYYDRKDRLRVGAPGNMAETVEDMVRFEKVIRI